MNEARISGAVKIVGSGLIGTSIGLALRENGVEVLLDDVSPAVLDLAVDFGAGKKFQASDSPSLVIVCTPPDVTSKIINEQLLMHTQATVTDVSSVKGTILEELVSLGADLERYVGSHPMAGRERAGSLAGRSDIFIGRPWVITPSDKSSSKSVMLVEQLATELGGNLLHMKPKDHDRAVALVSHAPQLVSSLLAGTLAKASGADISLAGQGLRDTTRIAASDAKLWLQILSANSIEIASVLRGLKADLDSVVAALEDTSRLGSLSTIGKLLEQGNLGVSKIPGKHGESATKYAKVTVMIDDKPGELARLITEIGEVGINLEDLTLEHATGAQVGLPELYVLEGAEKQLISELTSRGWKIVG